MQTIMAAARSLALILFGVVLALTFLQHVEPQQQLPLVKAEIPPCIPQGPLNGQPEEPEAPAGADIV